MQGPGSAPVTTACHFHGNQQIFNEAIIIKANHCKGEIFVMIDIVLNFREFAKNFLTARQTFLLYSIDN